MKKKQMKTEIKLLKRTVVNAKECIDEGLKEVESLHIQLEQQEEALAEKDAMILGLQNAQENLLAAFDRNSSSIKEAIQTCAANQPALKELYQMNDARKSAEARVATLESQLTELHERIALSHLAPGPLTEQPHTINATAKGIIHFALCDLAQAIEAYNVQPHKWTGRQIREIAQNLATKGDFAIKSVFKELGLHRYDEPLEELEQPEVFIPTGFELPEPPDVFEPIDDSAVSE